MAHAYAHAHTHMHTHTFPLHVPNTHVHTHAYSPIVLQSLAAFYSFILNFVSLKPNCPKKLLTVYLWEWECGTRVGESTFTFHFTLFSVI